MSANKHPYGRPTLNSSLSKVGEQLCLLGQWGRECGSASVHSSLRAEAQLFRCAVGRTCQGPKDDLSHREGGRKSGEAQLLLKPVDNIPIDFSGIS